MKHFLIALAIIFFGMGTAAAADVDQYKGTWTYSSAGTGEINKIVITGSGKYDARIFEKCSSGNCDMGKYNCSNALTAGYLFTSYQNDASKRDLRLTPVNTSTLEVKVHTSFTDSSGSPATDKTYTFRRLVVQQQQTPRPAEQPDLKPMDRVSPRPS
ncbi:MAG: hypothetical protein JW944_04195, partial [Deltaproteobacteria bacterium]|nr:hypothetical protein [Deltaproteobacteria bacterium]